MLGESLVGPHPDLRYFGPKLELTRKIELTRDSSALRVSFGVV